MIWTKRDVPDAAAANYTDIWDGEGWQINKTAEARGKPFLLLDTNMPWEVPASSVHGSYATLEEAQEVADKEGPPDWSEWTDYYGPAEP